MPDPTLSDAIKEAYATAPVDEIIYHTLELWHSAFSVPIRVVRDNGDLDARIEAGAARNAGEMVTFVGYAFDLVPPDQIATGLPECVIEIDNVARDILAELDLAIAGDGKITVIYRSYLSSEVSVGPENIPPLEMTIKTINATPFRIRAVAGFDNFLDRRFPALDYDLETFPGLQP